MENRNEWWSCNGRGEDGPASVPNQPTTPAAQAHLSRRGVLMGVGLSALAWAMPRTALSQISVRQGAQGHVLVSIFLRGGMDGLNVVVPYAEDAYHRQRPSLALKAPNDRRAAEDARTLDLDGFFGLNKALRDLYPAYQSGDLAIVHAVGSFDQTRSHFEAMNAMERGLPRQEEGAASGWLARHLTACPAESPTPLRAVAFGSVMPDALRGATDAISLQSLDEFRVQAEDEAQYRNLLASLYEGGKDAMSQAGRETLEVLDSLNKLDPGKYQPSHGAAYPDSDLGRGLKQVAFLVRAGVGMEIACLDKGGWDTHVAQGQTSGWLALLLDDVGKSLAAFRRDLGPEMARVTVAVQTEFGRRVFENAALGTDHGRASCLFLMGGGVKGGKVYARWPGLEVAQQEGPGDLKVTTDYRNVLAEILAKRTPATDLAAVFPGHRPSFLGILS